MRRRFRKQTLRRVVHAEEFLSGKIRVSAARSVCVTYFMQLTQCSTIFRQFTFVTCRNGFNTRNTVLHRIWRVTHFSGDRLTTVSLRERIFRKIIPTKRQPSRRRHDEVPLYHTGDKFKNRSHTRVAVVSAIAVANEVNCQIKGSKYFIGSYVTSRCPLKNRGVKARWSAASDVRACRVHYAWHFSRRFSY